MTNNLSCIPFYNNLEEQDYRKWYAYGMKFQHCVPCDYLVPFYVVIPKGYAKDKITLFNICGEDLSESVNPIDIDSILEDNLFIVKDFDDYAIATYYAKPVTSANLDEGMYYLKIDFEDIDENVVSVYSDIFTVKTRASLSSMLKLEWWDNDNLVYDGGLIPYGEEQEGTKFKNEIWLDTTIGKPTYTFTEEGEERNGYFFPIKQLSEKVYNMGFLATEYLCDAMRIVRLSDFVRLTTSIEHWSSGTRTSVSEKVFDIEQFEMNVTWSDEGHYAEVDCAMQTNTIVKKVGKVMTI